MSSRPTRATRGARLERAVFRLLLRAYGNAFRQRYQCELVTFFDQDRQRPIHRGPRGRARLWRRTVRDLAAAAVRDRTANFPWRPSSMINGLLFDLRLAARGMLREPGFALTATVTMATGLAATTLIFGLVDDVLLGPLPFPAADRVVVVQGMTTQERVVHGASFLEVRDWAAGVTRLEALSAYDVSSASLVAGDSVERVTLELVDPQYFAVLGARALQGRLPDETDNRSPDADPVVAIGEALWERRFGRDPRIIGESIRLNGREMVVVGILPSDFGGLSLQTEIWTPLMMASLIGRGQMLESRDQRWLSAVARLAPDATHEAAQEELDAVAARLAGVYPLEHEGRTGTLLDLRSAYVGPLRDILALLMAGAALVLIVAAANVAGLLLVRASDRRPELALRQALGSGRMRLVRQMLAESVMISLLGAGVGLVVAAWTTSTVVSMLPDGTLPAYVQPRVDARLFLFVLAALAGSAVFAGVLPAIRGVRTDLSETMRGVRATGGESGSVTRNTLVVAEIALALVLLVATALIGQTFAAKLAVPTGFQPENLSAFNVALPAADYDREATLAFAAALQDALRARPEVDAATYGTDLPMRGNTHAGFAFRSVDDEAPIRFYRHRVAPDFFEVMGIPLLRGRLLDSADTGSSLVTVVSREFAERYLADGDVGATIWFGPPDGRVSATVVGVVETVRWRDLTTDLNAEGSDPDLYFAFDQSPSRGIEMILSSRADETDIMAAARAAIAQVDGTLPIDQFRRLADLLRVQTAPDRLAATVLATFAAAALLLAGVGVYGTMAYAVSRRVREIAVRVALGATAAQVRREVLRQGMTLTALGAAIGIVAALGASRLLGSLLFGVASGDPLTLIGVAVPLLAVAFAASAIPAIRATRVEPLEALRAD